MLRIHMPVLDLVSDDEAVEPPGAPEEVDIGSSPLRWRRGVLHPPEGSVMEMSVPDVPLEDSKFKFFSFEISYTHETVQTKISLFVQSACSYENAGYMSAARSCRLPDLWEAFRLGLAVPEWALPVLSNFDWTPLRLHAYVEAVLRPSGTPEPDVMNVTPRSCYLDVDEPDVMNVTPRSMDLAAEMEDERDDSLVPSQCSMDLAEAALDRDLQKWEEQRDATPSPSRPLLTATVNSSATLAASSSEAALSSNAGPQRENPVSNSSKKKQMGELRSARMLFTSTPCSWP
eukprot:s135_g22.t1